MGQALGGHMRRHRGETGTTTVVLTAADVDDSGGATVPQPPEAMLDLNYPPPVAVPPSPAAARARRAAAPICSLPAACGPWRGRRERKRDGEGREETCHRDKKRPPTAKPDMRGPSTI